MNDAKAQIVVLFETLPMEERRDLLIELAQLADDFCEDDLTPEDIAAIEEGIAQVERGDVVDADEMFDRLAKKFGFTRA